MRRIGLTLCGLVLAGLALGFVAPIFAEDGSNAMSEPEAFEIGVGEPIWDAVSRSSRKYDFVVPLDMQSQDLYSSADSTRRLQIILRNGEGERAVLPYFPDDGTLWMYVGVTDEIDLNFYRFRPVSADAGGAGPEDPVAAAIEAIVAIYTEVMPLTVRPREQQNCYRNSIEVSTQPCERVTLITDRLTPEALRDELRNLHNLAMTEPPLSQDVPRTLSLGQWWLPDGGRAMMIVTAAAGSGDGPSRLSLRLNIGQPFNAQLARLMLACYDQQALFPEKMLYSQEQAARIFHGLYADFFPPTIDGEVVTDRIRLAELDWGPLNDLYWNDPQTRGNFCKLLRELERETGYQGPFAPPR